MPAEERQSMANEKHLAILNQGRDVWNEWRQEHPRHGLTLVEPASKELTSVQQRMEIRLMRTVDFDEAVEQYQRALGEFVRGNPEPNKLVFSHHEDVTLANPLGPAARGWEQVEATMDRTAAQMSEGEVTDFEIVAQCVTAELAYVVWVERTKAKLGGRQEIVPFDLRVTTIFRPEDGTWKVVHRHADPITTARPIESLTPK